MTDVNSTALTNGHKHYCAISFFQGPYNNRCVQVTGITKHEMEKVLESFGNAASDHPLKHIDIAGYTPLEVANFLSEKFGYQIISSVASDGVFVFVLEH